MEYVYLLLMETLGLRFEEIERGDVFALMRLLTAKARHSKTHAPAGPAEQEMTIDEWRRTRDAG